MIYSASTLYPIIQTSDLLMRFKERMLIWPRQRYTYKQWQTRKRVRQ
jgi:hypothetical protein